MGSRVLHLLRKCDYIRANAEGDRVQPAFASTVVTSSGKVGKELATLLHVSQARKLADCLVENKHREKSKLSLQYH